MKEQRICPVCSSAYTGRSDKKYCSLECKNKESNKTVMQLYYAGKAIHLENQNKVLLVKKKLQSVREKSSSILNESLPKKRVNGIGTLKIKVLKNLSQVQKNYASKCLKQEQISIETLEEHLYSIANQQFFDTSNVASLKGAASIMKELLTGKVLSFTLGKETTIFKYLGNNTVSSWDYSVEI
jgi:predicted nucleic acid-binding Zn ribbon protein